MHAVVPANLQTQLAEAVLNACWLLEATAKAVLPLLCSVCSQKLSDKLLLVSSQVFKLMLI